jgi:hypothetical protein
MTCIECHQGIAHNLPKEPGETGPQAESPPPQEEPPSTQ